MHKNPLRKQFESESLVRFYSSSRLSMVTVSRISLKGSSTNNESPWNRQDWDNIYIGFIHYSKYCIYQLGSRQVTSYKLFYQRNFNICKWIG